MSKLIEFISKYADQNDTDDKNVCVSIRADKIIAVEDESDWKNRGCKIYTEAGDEIEVEETYEQVTSKIEVALNER